MAGSRSHLAAETDHTLSHSNHANKYPIEKTSDDANGDGGNPSDQHPSMLMSGDVLDGYPNSVRQSREAVLQRLSEALLRRSLTKIDLSQRGLQPSDAKLVKMALSQNAKLTVLKLGYNNLGDEGVSILAGGIAIHRSLVSLDLGFNNIGDRGCKALANALRSAMNTKEGSNLRTLYLAGNLIGEEGARALSDIVGVGSSLSRLYMTGNRLGPDGVSALVGSLAAEELRRTPPFSEGPTDASERRVDSDADVVRRKLSSLSFTGVQELFLGGTAMGSVGCQSVSKLLESTSCLQIISLANCCIGDEDVATLAAAIKSNKDKLPLSTLQLSFNNISHKGLEALTNSLWGSTTLRELRIDNNEIGDRGAHQIAAILPSVKSLRILDLGFNSVKAPGLNSLMKAVAETDHLESLSISGNSVDVTAAKAVAYAMAYNHSLHSMFLVHCSIALEGQRHIVAGIVSNSMTKLRGLTGFAIGPVVITLGFPDALKHWTNEQVLNFVHVMWEDMNATLETDDAGESDLDPLNFLPGSHDDQNSQRKKIPGPYEAPIVVDVAKKAFKRLVENGVDVFTRRPGEESELLFGSPLADEKILIESSGVVTKPSTTSLVKETSKGEFGSSFMPSDQAKSFVAAPESTVPKHSGPDPERKKRIVEWLCSNIEHLNELAQLPFSSSELWRLHQHYFTPVVNETGGAVGGGNEMVVSSVPDVSRPPTSGSAVTPSTQSSDGHMSLPASDAGPPSAPASLPMLKRKVSYRFLGEATLSSQTRHEKYKGSYDISGHQASIARMIEDGHTGHSLPPKTKRARRNRTRISFVPRIKAKLDSYLDVCHEKALITMRQLYFVEQALLSGQINQYEHGQAQRSHLCGVMASEAEMIIVDMV